MLPAPPLPAAVVGDPAYRGLTTNGEGQNPANIAAAAADGNICAALANGEASVTTGVCSEDGSDELTRVGLVGIPVIGGGLCLILLGLFMLLLVLLLLELLLLELLLPLLLAVLLVVPLLLLLLLLSAPLLLLVSLQLLLMEFEAAIRSFPARTKFMGTLLVSQTLPDDAGDEVTDRSGEGERENALWSDDSVFILLDEPELAPPSDSVSLSEHTDSLSVESVMNLLPLLLRLSRDEDADDPERGDALLHERSVGSSGGEGEEVDTDIGMVRGEGSKNFGCRWNC